MAEIEGKRPAAIAAVAQWPDDVATWRSVYGPTRVGQVRPEQEAEFDTATVDELDPQVAEAIRGAAAIINENHAVLSTHEREAMAGALVALRSAEVPVDREALRAYLMSAGWQGRLVTQVLELADRIDRGQTPRHSHFQLAR
jgi:folylpolyglutamate synthase/dihydropteroate synthase